MGLVLLLYAVPLPNAVTEPTALLSRCAPFDRVFTPTVCSFCGTVVVEPVASSATNACGKWNVVSVSRSILSVAL